MNYNHSYNATYIMGNQSQNNDIDVWGGKFSNMLDSNMQSWYRLCSNHTHWKQLKPSCQVL